MAEAVVSILTLSHCKGSSAKTLRGCQERFSLARQVDEYLRCTSHPGSGAGEAAANPRELSRIPYDDTPLFSVVTVTLNCVDDAARTARSVLTQSFTDYEYMSKTAALRTDARTLTRSWRREGTRFCGQGIYDAMEQGLRLCRGRFIHFLNAATSLPTVECCRKWRA